MDVNVDNNTSKTTTTATVVVPATTTTPPPMSISPELNQHYQQHFQQHYASTSAAHQSSPSPPQLPPQQQHKSMITFHPNVASSSSSSSAPGQQQQHIQSGVAGVSGGGGGGGAGGTAMNDSYESRFQVIESDPLGNVRKIEEKREQHSKRTTQTTTTTTSTSQPMLLNTSELAGVVGQQSISPVHFADTHAHLTYVQQPVPVYAIAAAPCLPISVLAPPPPLPPLPPPPPPPQPVSHYTTTSGNITVEHYPTTGHFSWTNADTYMHIFLTFYFGHFAAMLFFDGIIRNFVALYLFEHRNWSMLIYILHIILSIALLAFCVWFLTICWRWWRNKSLLPMYGLPYYDYNQRPLGPKERQATFHGCVFTAAVILIISFFCYLVLGVLDLNFKRHLQSYYYSSPQANGHYHSAAYYGDLVVFILRLIFWIVGIVVTLLLSRDVLFKFCCPERRIRIDKERPTTVYEVRRPSPPTNNTNPNNSTTNTNTAAPATSANSSTNNNNNNANNTNTNGGSNNNINITANA